MRALLGIVALAGALIVACRPQPPPGPSSLATVLRVVDALRPRAGIVQGDDVRLAQDTRRTVMLPASALALAELQPSGDRYHVAPLPEAMRGWRQARLVRQAVTPSGSAILAPVDVDLTSGAIDVAVGPPETKPATMPLALYAETGRAPTVETAPFTVAPGAVLRFDVGVHALATRLQTQVGARVSVVDGRAARTLWRGQLSGADATWHAAHASLAPYTGRRIRLRFTTHPGPRAADAGMFAVFGEPVVLAPAAVPYPGFNVVLVSMDTLRARSLGAYGCARPTSPTIDALAADGALFENAFSTAAFTLPGHLSMFTGLWFRTHEALLITSTLSPDHRTLAEVLRGAGYATGAFTSGAWIVPWAGFRRGFDAYYEMHARGNAPPYETFTRGLDWMRANADRPFYAFMHNYVVHAAYTPPPPYNRMFDPLPPGASDLERKRLAYEQEVRYGDDQVRALLEGLEAIGVADRTLVIVTADHGEQFGEHGGIEHTYAVHDEVVRVPLVMRLPGAIPAGLRIAEPASLADIVPTVVDLLGLPPLAGVDGMSLFPLLAGTAARLPRDGVFSEAASEQDLGWANLAAVHTRTVSCIHDARADTQECYDRRRDPWQDHPPLPAGDSSRDVVEAKAILARFEAAKPPPGTPHDVAAAESAPALPPAAVRDERREQLRALGYVE